MVSIDTNLLFLKELESEDLDNLYTILVYGNKDDRYNNNKNLMEGLSNNTKVKLYYPDHKKYYELMASELCEFGGNSICNWFRGRGVPYREVLSDVSSKFGVKDQDNLTIEELENALILETVKKAINKMSESERFEMAKSLNLNLKTYTTEALYAAFMIGFRIGGFKSYQLTVIIANNIVKAITGAGLSFVGNATLTKFMSIITGPIGWIVTGIWTAIDIAGPAYRITIPAVFEIILLRNKLLATRRANSKDQNDWINSIHND
ncbi:ubiquinol-cytochrome C chaperone family protein [Snodgrassella alvi]|uniref:ubiquinol-cytochrome C chaperone family protein n=1 Tax=Snodgrassella alvi TaxID=1196083 RepID=UPI0035128C4D